MAGFKPFYCSMLAAVLVSAGSSAAHASQAMVTARLIGTLSADERLHLPGSTKVVVNGRTITLDAVRAAHSLRLREFAEAAGLGRSVALTIRGASQAGNASTLEVFKKTDHEVRYKTSTAGVFIGVIGIGKPTSLPSFLPSKIRPGQVMHFPMVIPIPQSTLKKYAKDYQDFCIAAMATACVYLPAVQSWQTGSSSNIVGNEYTLLSVLDPLITDPALCKSEGGSMTQPGCVYNYPYVETTDFTPAASNSYVTDCPGGSNDWNITIDPHGAVSLYAYYGAWPYTSSISCVVQVFS